MGTIQDVSISLDDGRQYHVIAKIICMPKDCQSVGDLRKRDSYMVETNFYERGHAQNLNQMGVECPMPLLIERGSSGLDLAICATKLDGIQIHGMSDVHTKAALHWLARFHATYWGPPADVAVRDGGLQPQGCYWYLDTRLDEHARMPTSGWQGRLRLAARGIDQRLKQDRFQTICHGDAKSENMLFRNSTDGMLVAFCDFQYTGKATPAKDLAYCLLCTKEDLSSRQQASYLEYYLGVLSPLLLAKGQESPTLPNLLASCALSQCDLARWMSGWGWLGHEQMMRERCKTTLDRVDHGSALESEQAYTDAIFAAFPC